MRTSALIGSVLAMAVNIMPQRYALDIRPLNVMDFDRPKRRKTGHSYPHSSTRQRARYARQIAAGQIRNA